jgi:hypothetical protein
MLFYCRTAAGRLFSAEGIEMDLGKEAKEMGRELLGWGAHLALRFGAVIAAACAYVGLGTLAGAWHPAWLSLAIGAAALGLFFWTRHWPDALSGAVALAGAVVCLALGETPVAFKAAIGSVAAAVLILNWRIVELFI